MDWNLARERLGAELIGAREAVAARFRQSLREQGRFALALEQCAAELVLQAGAALSDEMPPEAPWRRCGSVLRIDARTQGRTLFPELTALWKSMATTVSRVAMSVDEDRRARDVLGGQLEATLRGASAELRRALLDAPIDEATQRFGGVTVVCWDGVERESDTEQAA